MNALLNFIITCMTFNFYLRIHHQIGSGEFGTVSLAQLLDSSNESRIVAVK